MSSKREQGEALLLQEVPAAEIAARLGVSASTVRSWKSRMKKGTLALQSVATKVQRNRGAKTLDKMVETADENQALTEQQKRFCIMYARRPNATQAYRLAFGDCAYSTMRAEGSRLLTNHNIRKEIKRQKKIVMEEVLADPSDLFRLYWDIAFSDMGEFVEWGQEEVAVMGSFGPLLVEREGKGTTQKVPMTKIVNVVKFRPSDQVDGTLLAEVKQGRDGASVKLADRHMAMRWLSDYFEMNPKDRHKKEYELRRLALEEGRMGAVDEDEGDIVFEILPAGEETGKNGKEE